MSEHKITLDHGDGTQLWCAPSPAVQASGFIPVTEMRVITQCTDGAGRDWQSQNGYLVSALTNFATDKTAAVGDDYYGIAPEGPIYSLRCLAGVGHEFVLPEDGCLEFQFKLFDGDKEIWSESAQRVTTAPEPPMSGATVVFFHNDTQGAKPGSELLKSLGHKVLSFHVQAENPDMTALLEELKTTLSAEDSVHIVASGRASEPALELAQVLENLKSVSIFSGSGLRFSPWKIGEKQCAHVACDHSAIQPRGQTTISTRKIYAEAVADRKNRDLGRIEVENINCPLYLFSGSDDQIWPSAAFSELAAQRRKAHGREKDTIHRTFPNVGYDLGPELGLPCLPTTERTIGHPPTGFRLALGGKMGRQARARRECWEALHQILGGCSTEALRVFLSNTTPTNP